MCPFWYPPRPQLAAHISPRSFASHRLGGGYQHMRTGIDETKIDAATWAPWALQLLSIVDAVQTVAASCHDNTIKRLKLAELAVRARHLLDEIGARPTLPGAFGRAIDVLRSPTAGNPVQIGEAIGRLGQLAALLDPDVPRRSRRPRDRCQSPDQDSLPGLEPPTPEGVNQ